jgi:fatty acid desaturase
VSTRPSPRRKQEGYDSYRAWREAHGGRSYAEWDAIEARLAAERQEEERFASRAFATFIGVIVGLAGAVAANGSWAIGIPAALAGGTVGYLWSKSK